MVKKKKAAKEKDVRKEEPDLEYEMEALLGASEEVEEDVEGSFTVKIVDGMPKVEFIDWEKFTVGKIERTFRHIIREYERLRTSAANQKIALARKERAKQKLIDEEKDKKHGQRYR